MNDSKRSQLEAGHYIDEAIRSAAEGFAEYIVEEAGIHIRAETFDIDAVRDGLNELDHNGYRISDREDDADGYGFAGVRAYNDLQASRDAMIRLPEDNDDADRYGLTERAVNADGLHIRADQSLPDGLVIMVHPDAIMPTAPARPLAHLRRPGIKDAFTFDYRPWDIRDADGVAVVEVNT
jgi:hypothetical protein